MEAGNIVLADPVQMHQVMMNLCMNAVHAMRGKDGVLEVTLAKVETYQDEAAAQLMGVRPGPYVQLTVKDNGQGMSREVLERAFDPFFTTKQKGEGSGMGLAVVHGIVEKHEGAVRLESEEGRGTAVNIFLPVFQGEAIESTSSAPGEIPRGKERILFVDDEESQVRSVQPVLQRLGYRVTAEMDPRKALGRFRSQPEAFDLVITDQIMPYLPGNRLAQELLVIRPDIPIILCTGFSDMVDKGKAKAIGIRDFILKPFRLMEISGMIRKVLDENRAK
jgi:CheY-like chemotaxis protein